MISSSLKSKNIVLTDVLHFAGPGLATGLPELGATLLVHDDAFADKTTREAFANDHPSLLVAEALTAQDLAAEALERLGSVDVVINNDAYPAPRIPIDEAKPDDLRAALERLLVRGFELTGALVPQMKSRGAGKVIFISSAGPFGGIPDYTIYAAARSGVNGMIRSLAMELAPHNIQVNAVAPNYLDNPDYYPKELMANPRAAEKILSRIPLGRLGTQEEAAALIAFLAGDHSGFVTGQVIPFAGGWA
jgi:NAD(P)-dependent dehydrogenase (short-subunit alcohol dehydrogenase family)